MEVAVFLVFLLSAHVGISSACTCGRRNGQSDRDRYCIAILASVSMPAGFDDKIKEDFMQFLRPHFRRLKKENIKTKHRIA